MSYGRKEELTPMTPTDDGVTAAPAQPGEDYDFFPGVPRVRQLRERGGIKEEMADCYGSTPSPQGDAGERSIVETLLDPSSTLRDHEQHQAEWEREQGLGEWHQPSPSIAGDVERVKEPLRIKEEMADCYGSAPSPQGDAGEQQVASALQGRDG